MPRRPRLTKRIINGLDFLAREIEVTMDARHGWDDYYENDDDQEKAVLYIEALVDWYRQRSHHHPAHAKGRGRCRRA